MGKSYSWDVNPFQDFLFGSIMNGVDITDKEIETEIYMAFFSILEYYVPDENQKIYLDFEIRNKKGSFKVVAKNIITALWLSGIFPSNLKKVMVDNEYIIENMKYKYNQKTKKLTYQLIKK